jgi:tripartite-type tricarboxylate transporter receptor subunit TctC
MLDSLGAGWGHISGGRFRPLAITARARSERLPETPTMVELGLDPREFVAWYAFMAPKQTPPEVVSQLNAAVNKVLAEPDIIARLRELGAAPRITTPAESHAFMQAEQREFGGIARAGKIQVSNAP